MLLAASMRVRFVGIIDDQLVDTTEGRTRHAVWGFHQSTAQLLKPAQRVAVRMTETVAIRLLQKVRGSFHLSNSYDFAALVTALRT